MKKLEVHVIELAEWRYSEVVQANKTRGNNEHLHSMASTRLGSNITSAPLHDHRMIIVFHSLTKRGPGHNWHRTSSGMISKVSCRIFKN